MANSVMPSPEQEPLLTVERAGEILGLGRSAAYGAVNRGEIPSLVFGRKIMVPTAQLRKLVGLDTPDH